MSSLVKKASQIKAFVRSQAPKNPRFCQRFLLDTLPPLDAALPLIERAESDGQGCHGNGCTCCAGYLRPGPDTDQHARWARARPGGGHSRRLPSVLHFVSPSGRPVSHQGGGAKQTSATFFRSGTLTGPSPPATSSPVMSSSNVSVTPIQRKHPREKRS